MLGKLIAELQDEQRQMQAYVFEFPPADWVEFKQRLGKWQGLQSAIDVMSAVTLDDERKEL